MRPKPVEHFADLYLRQSSRQRMSTLFCSGRDYASELSLFVVTTVPGKVGPARQPLGLTFTPVQQDSSVVLGDYPNK
jgi:hypothetical protein